MGNVALRTSLIWHDEVMADLVHDRPTPITIGPSSEATFLTPDLKLPAELAILRPGHRGYLLTLGDRMRGTISVAGVEHDVAAFVRAADDPSEFRATPIGGSDWGVVELDETGDCKLFFQFVPVDEAPWNIGPPLLDGESRASLAFSVVLHLALLVATFKLADSSSPFVWPGPRSMTGSYIVTRLDIDPPLTPTVTETESGKPAVAMPTVPETPSPQVATPIPRSRGPWQRPNKPPRPDSDANDDDDDAHPDASPADKAPEPTINTGVMKYEDLLRGVRDRELAKAIKRHNKLKNGKYGMPGDGGPSGDDGFTAGPAGGPRGGPGKKDGPLGEHKGRGAIDTGGNRDAVCVGADCKGGGGTPISLVLPPDPPADEPTITKEEIDRVIKKNAGLFRHCYQQSLDRKGPIAGNLIVKFAINGAGRVTSARSGGGTLAGTDIASCVNSKLTLLRFPAKGGALVNYPFVFSSGG